MSDEKRATLKKVLMAVMSVGALSRAPVHAATPHTGSTNSKATTPAAGANAMAIGTNDTAFTDAFHDVFNNANPYVQTFGDLFVEEGPFYESACW